LFPIPPTVDEEQGRSKESKPEKAAALKYMCPCCGSVKKMPGGTIGFNGMRLAVAFDVRFINIIKAARVDITPSSRFRVCQTCNTHCQEALKVIKQTSHQELFSMAGFRTRSKFAPIKATLFDNGTIFKIAENTETFTTMVRSFVYVLQLFSTFTSFSIFDILF
jgi:hypothetical protein